MVQFKLGDNVWVKGHRRIQPLVVGEVNPYAIVCVFPDRTTYLYPHDALELVTSDPSRGVRPNVVRRKPYGYRGL
jgi:hypothetical protein